MPFYCLLRLPPINSLLLVLTRQFGTTANDTNTTVADRATTTATTIIDTSTTSASVPPTRRRCGIGLSAEGEGVHVLLALLFHVAMPDRQRP